MLKVARAQPREAPMPVVVQSKSWLESITTWGGIFSLLGTLLGMFGISLPPDQQAAAADAAGGIAAAWASRDWVGLAGAVVTLGGIVMAMVGRGQADQRVHFLQPFTYTLANTAVVAPGATTK